MGYRKMKTIVGIFEIGPVRAKPLVLLNPKIIIEHHVESHLFDPVFSFGSSFQPLSSISAGSYVSITFDFGGVWKYRVSPCFWNVVFNENNEMQKFTVRADDGTCWIYGFTIGEKGKQK